MVFYFYLNQATCIIFFSLLYSPCYKYAFMRSFISFFNAESDYMYMSEVAIERLSVKIKKYWENTSETLQFQ